MTFLQSKLTLVSAGLLLAGLSAMALPAEMISFHPEEGTELAKAFETRVSLAIESILVEINGEEIDLAMLGMPFDVDQLKVDASMTMRVEDTYVEMGDNRPLELLRSYVELSSEFENGFGNSDSIDSSEDDGIAGSTVRFLWDPDEEAYVTSYDGEGGDEDKLSLLSEDMDLRTFLPAGEVEEGDTWQLDWSDNFGLVMPGFKLENVEELLEAEDDGDFPVEVIKNLMAELRDVFEEAELECTFEGTRKVDGLRVGVIAIASEFDGSVDLLQFGEDAMALSGEEIPDGVSFDQLDLDFSMEVTGELLWDLAGGHFHSLEMEADTSGEMTLEVTATEQGAEVGFHGSVEFAGAFGRSVELE